MLSVYRGHAGVTAYTRDACVQPASSMLIGLKAIQAAKVFEVAPLRRPLALDHWLASSWGEGC